MSKLTLREIGSIVGPETTVKNAPLTNFEADNNFSNLNISIGVLSNLETTSNANLVVAINEVRKALVDGSSFINNGTSNISILDVNGNITFSSALLPFVANTISIGAPNRHVKDIFVSGNVRANAIQISNVFLTVGGSGNILINGTTALDAFGAVVPDSTIVETKIANGAVTEQKIATSSVTNAKIAPSNVSENKIADLAVTESKIATGAVTNAKLPSSVISENKIASSAVTETKIATGAITETKIASGAVTGSKLTSNLSFSGTTSFPSTSLDQANVIASSVGGNVSFNLYDRGVVFYTGTSTTNANITVNFTAQDTVNVGNITSFVLIVTNNVANRPRVTTAQVNGSANPIRFLGDTSPVGQPNIDVYSFNVIKTGVSSYTILSSKQNYN